MVNLALIQLIFYNFMENHIKWLTILHCWNAKSQMIFTERAMQQNLYVQLWPVNQVNFSEDLESSILQHPRPHTGVYIDMNCNNSLEFLQRASKDKLFKHHYHWLVYDDSEDLGNFQEIFGNFNMAVDADVTLIMPSRDVINSFHNSSFLLYDAYNNGFNLGGKLNITIDRAVLCTREKCILKQYLSSLHEKEKYEHRWYLRDLTMRVSTVVTKMSLNNTEEKLLNHLRDTVDIHIDSICKFGYQYLMILRENLECNFRYNFTDAWSRTQIWGGCVGAIGLEQTADLSSSPFLSNLPRMKYVRAMMELGNFRQVCMFRTPQNSGIQGAVFLEPFSPKVWIFFGVLLILAAVLLWFTFVVEFYKLKKCVDFVPSLLTTCLISFGSACYQGSFIIPSSMGGRIVFITLSLLTFIIYNYYTSIVVAILLGSPVKSNIKTLGQLADSNLDVGLEAIPYMTTYLNITNLPEIKRFKRNKIESKRDPKSVWLSVDEGLRRVRENPGFVYVFEAFSGYGLVEKSYTAKEICDLNEILFRPEQALYTHLPKNSSYTKIIKMKQIRIWESGVYRRYYRRWVKTRLNCYLSSSFLVQVGLEYTAPLFIMLAASYIFVVVIMLLEILWWKFEKKFQIWFWSAKRED